LNFKKKANSDRASFMPDNINGWREFIFPTPFHDISKSDYNLLNFNKIINGMEIKKSEGERGFKD
jgi:hypothetical protein